MNKYVSEDIIDFRKLFKNMGKKLYITLFISILFAISLFVYGKTSEKVIYDAEAYVAFRSYPIKDTEGIIAEIRAKYVNGAIEKKLDDISFTSGNRTSIVMKASASTKEEARNNIMEPLEDLKKLHENLKESNAKYVKSDLEDVKNDMILSDKENFKKHSESLELTYKKLLLILQQNEMKEVEQLGKVLVYQRPFGKSKKFKLMILGFISSFIICTFFIFLWEFYIKNKDY